LGWQVSPRQRLHFVTPLLVENGVGGVAIMVNTNPVFDWSWRREAEPTERRNLPAMATATVYKADGNSYKIIQNHRRK
jgi:hypothetical protein